ncbi:hypothetical protein ACVWZM_001710 [Bradyrhizobium sp. USDA 4501]
MRREQTLKKRILVVTNYWPVETEELDGSMALMTAVAFQANSTLCILAAPLAGRLEPNPFHTWSTPID